MQTKKALKNISIILVEPRSPGNIGSTARVMKNTGLRDLRIVTPPADPVNHQSEEALYLACNATDVLGKARFFPTIEAAIDGANMVVGTTRRTGKIRFPIFSLAQATEKIIGIGPANKVAILFGREDKGLKNEEVDICDLLLEIPTHKDQPSLNLSHAVFAVCHSLFTSTVSEEPPFELARRTDVLNMYTHLEVTLRSLGYGDHRKHGDYLLETIMRNFKRLFGRSSLMEKEANMIRGILTSMDQAFERGAARPPANDNAKEDEQ
jgi:TrmH family RNA methyltransferase